MQPHKNHKQVIAVTNNKLFFYFLIIQKTHDIVKGNQTNQAPRPYKKQNEKSAQKIALLVTN
jgi:hypothetical protein